MRMRGRSGLDRRGGVGFPKKREIATEFVRNRIAIGVPVFFLSGWKEGLSQAFPSSCPFLGPFL
jgi:hypothetical protein